MAIMAECESSLLALNDFEDIITYLKTEPCEWENDKLQGLISAAYLSSVSDSEIQLAGEVRPASQTASGCACACMSVYIAFNVRHWTYCLSDLQMYQLYIIHRYTFDCLPGIPERSPTILYIFEWFPPVGREVATRSSSQSDSLNGHAYGFDGVFAVFRCLPIITGAWVHVGLDCNPEKKNLECGWHATFSIQWCSDG